MTIARLIADWIMLLRTCPVSTEGRKIAIVRNRAMIPSDISSATVMAVPCTTPAMAMRMIPGTT
jgi:hypothetical protein